MRDLYFIFKENKNSKSLSLTKEPDLACLCNVYISSYTSCKYTYYNLN